MASWRRWPGGTATSATALGEWCRAFKDRDAGRKLLKVAVVLNTEGPHAAYRLMAGPARLRCIGPAFGTKFLYFADHGRHGRRALILDSLVANWLSNETTFQVNAVRWAPAKYDAYLEQMHDWAGSLAVDPDALERAIFQAQSKDTQWRER